jgi:hypothetical protein
MHLAKYAYKTNETFLDYEFESSGPKGKIKKVVRFTEIRKDVYNIAFGDLDDQTGEISDTAVTNNNDSKKVLSTVSAIVFDFTEQYPGSWVVAKGSTHSRTRLYRMGITNHFEDISALFEVFGLNGLVWAEFEPGKDYDAFLVRRK